jgi:predicted alpha/beta superfamily hydrolase
MGGLKVWTAVAAAMVLAIGGGGRAAEIPMTPAAGALPAVMPASAQFELASKISGRTYRVWVRTPIGPPPAGGWPVVVVTDGNGLFPIAAETMVLRQLRGDKGALVVGVGYPVITELDMLELRNRDLTPTPFNPADNPGGPPMKESGGAELFYRFLTEELRPAIAAAYPTNPKDQTLYGHSLGGLFTLGVLFRHPAAYSTYLASSPSIWWDRRVVLKDEARFEAKVAAGEVAPRVLIVVGADEETPPKRLPPGLTAAAAKASAARARMVSNARELALRLAKVKGRAPYEVRFHAFEDEDHMSVLPASISRTLGFALAPK